ncbi:GCN5-related N-acetyltransferase [Arcobacter nitrofigilis DSM 7299]|uniref:GCN5-related N-acetyltransferase n=1 Tax=Arcobacter nitrofigilis (strain ATCC 33309 / DSM 7299 / CCUG 15893 / LMG 7604 / NCTC 12251 / CI) TaxID=572480 RepID=D5V075_ARCNC|nr:GNAT family N-acetyltransferase [Arcobacter nitrofigilis]ADG93687.1 GCN5-related N-acetyltransferase [Arcobacter nitrofigilis DSM 7299]
MNLNETFGLFGVLRKFNKIKSKENMIEIETNRLFLRNWKSSDYKDLYEYGKNDLVGPSAGWAIHKSEDDSKEVIKTFIKNDDSLAIVLKSENKVIGGIGLHKIVLNKNCKKLNEREIGYALNSSYWGNGYIPEAVNSLLEIGFEKMNLDLIWCSHFEENKNSKRVTEKCGFYYKFKKAEILSLLDNKKVTSLYYSISKDEYKNPNIYKK